METTDGPAQHAGGDYEKTTAGGSHPRHRPWESLLMHQQQRERVVRPAGELRVRAGRATTRPASRAADGWTGNSRPATPGRRIGRFDSLNSYDGFPPCLRARMEREDDRDPQANALPDFSLAPVASYFLVHEPGTITAAYGLFLQVIGVNPEGSPRCLQEIDAIHDAFISWFAYDYKCPDERTPLERYLDDNSVGLHRLPRAQIDALWTVLNCSVEGAFEVTAVWRGIAVVMLRGLGDDEEYAIHDEAMARSLVGCEDSIICARLTQFGTQWRVTARPFHVVLRGVERVEIGSGGAHMVDEVRKDHRNGSDPESDRRSEASAYVTSLGGSSFDRAAMASMNVLMLLRIVFGEPADAPYDPQGFEERDHLMLRIMLNELGAVD